MWRKVCLTLGAALALLAINYAAYRPLRAAFDQKTADPTMHFLPRVEKLSGARYGLPWDALRGVAIFLRLPAPTAADQRPAHFGFEGALCDALWVRGIWYIHEQFDEIERCGGKRPPGLYRQLQPLYETITDLDPYFIDGYRIGAIFLTVLARKPDAAIALLKKGLAVPENRARWELNYDLGTIYFLEKNDFDTAADYFMAAAQDPDSPDFVPHVASYFLRKAKHEYALSFWQRRLESRNEGVRRVAKIEMGRVRIEQFADLFKELVGRYPSDVKELLKPGPLAKLPEPQARKYFERTFGRPPKDTAEMREKLQNMPFVSQLPEGPGEGEYVINAKTGKVVYVEKVKGEKKTKK